MKKNIITLFLLLFFQVTAFAAAKPAKEVTLDFTLNYKNDSAESPTEHVMKDAIQMSGNHWHVAGKFQNNKNDEVLLFLVRQLAQHNNKYTFRFMIIDSSNMHVFISEPKVTALVGLPSQMVVTGEGRTITLNTLVTLSGQSKKGETKVLQK